MANQSVLNHITIQGLDVVAMYRVLDQLAKPVELEELASLIGFCHPDKDIPDSLSDTLTYLGKLGVVKQTGENKKGSVASYTVAPEYAAPPMMNYELATIAALRKFDSHSLHGPHGAWRVLIQARKNPLHSQKLTFSVAEATDIVRNSDLPNAEDWTQDRTRNMLFRVYAQLGVLGYVNSQVTLSPQMTTFRKLVGHYVQDQSKVARQGPLGLRGLVTFIDDHYFNCLVDGQLHPGLQGALKHLESQRTITLSSGSDAANTVKLGATDYDRFEWKGLAS